MARSLPNISMQKPSFLPLPISFFIIFIAVFSVFSIVTFLCASHKAKKLQSHKKEASAQFGEKKLVSKLQENISSKALLMVKMISWRKGEGEEEFMDEDEAVWKRTIIMGERCRPLDFSGKIVYDSQGNLLPN